MNKQNINSIILILLFTIAPFQQPLTAAPKASSTTVEQLNKSGLKQDYHYFFDSNIFDAYRVQFQTFANQQLSHFPALQRTEDSDPFVNQVIQFINMLQTKVLTESYQQKRTQHDTLVRHLREINQVMQEKSYHKDTTNPAIAQAIKFIEACNLWIFTQSDLVHPMQAFLFSQGILNKDLIEAAKVTALIESTLQFVSTSGNYKGNFSVDADYLDPYFEGFIPSILFKAFSTQFIWIPRMTIEKVATRKISINPEFLSYLRVLKQQGKKHLYINLMQRTRHEGAQSRALEALASNPLYSDVLITLTLDKNSDFYWQEKQFSKFSDANIFKQSFVKQLFYLPDDESMFYWPKHINADLKSSFTKIIDTVHAQFFENKIVLSNQERQAFIEICYVKFIEQFCKYYQPDYVNVSCKFSMDRGPSLFAFIYAYDAIINRPKRPEEPLLNAADKIQILTTLFAPPILSHNRPPYDYRIDRIKEAIIYLEKAALSIAQNKNIYTNIKKI